MTQGYTIAPRAVVEQRAMQLRAMLAVRNGFKTARQAWSEYIDELTALLREARQETPDDRMIQTKCSDCGHVHTMASHVGHYRCSCDPHTDRFPFNERYIVEAEEK